MDDWNKTEDQRRLERVEEEVVMLREMVLTLLSQSNRDYFRDDLARKAQIAREKAHQRGR